MEWRRVYCVPMARTIRETAIGPCPEMVLLSSCCVCVSRRACESEVGCRVMCTRYRGCGGVGEIKQQALMVVLVGVD
jgi:hypothetical protein